MNINLYKEIFKRKSFHLFRNTGDLKISDKELNIIKEEFNKLDRLDNSIDVEMIISNEEGLCNRGQEYCILLYSQVKDNYLENIGYIGEQLDLLLVSMNIGTLWYGLGKVDNKYINDKEFVIMIAIKKIDDVTKFRKDMFKSKRMDIKQFWSSDDLLDIANIVRFSPSACNSQPWRVRKENDLLIVKRISNKKGIMPLDKCCYYNSIDIGIFLYFLELCFSYNNIKFKRELLKPNYNMFETDVSIYKLI